MTTATKATPEQLVAPWMRVQHGLVTRSQALESGVSECQLEWRLRQRFWIPIQRGVYAPSSGSQGREQAILAACLAIDGGAVASHRSAAWLWGLVSAATARVEVTVPHGRRHGLPGVVIHRSRRALGSAKRHGIPVTSPVATIIDLAQIEDGDLLDGALDCGHRAGLVKGHHVLAELDRHNNRGVAGVWKLRALLAERGYPGVPSSMLERRTLAILRQGGVPEPVRELATGPERQYRVDFAWPAARVMVEVDGFDSHGTPEALRADLARQNKLVAMGWAPLRYTARDVRQRPDHVVEEVKRMLDRSRQPR